MLSARRESPYRSQVKLEREIGVKHFQGRQSKGSHRNADSSFVAKNLFNSPTRLVSYIIKPQHLGCY